MKKLFVLLLTAVISISLCGCEVLDDINSQLNYLIETDRQDVYIIETEKVEAVNINPRPISDDDSTYLYCYAQLNKEQKRIYRILLEAVEKMQSGWISLEKCNEDFGADIAVAYQALSNDHPEFFWMPYTYLLSNSGAVSEPTVLIALSITQDKHTCEYLVSPEDRKNMENALNQRVNDIIGQVKGMSIYQTELYLHDLICRNTEYTTGEAADMVFTAYGALINGKAVCEGYSRAMQLLCKRLGIPCALTIGVADGEGHMWNIINPGDGWYNLDLTWDDATEDNTTLYSYFNITDKELKKTHTSATHFSKLSADTIIKERNFNLIDPHCTKSSYNYFVHENLEFGEDYAKNVAESIILADGENKKQLQFRFNSEALAASFSADYQNYVMDIQQYLHDILANSAPQISNISIYDIYVTLYW